MTLHKKNSVNLFVFYFIIILISDYLLVLSIHNLKLGLFLISRLTLESVSFLIVITLLNLIKFKPIRISLITIITTCYCIINILQIISVAISGEFITRLAIDNIEFIKLILTEKNIVIISLQITYLIFIPLLIITIPMFFKKRYQIYSFKVNFIILLFGITLTVLGNSFSRDIYTEQKPFFLKSKIENISPIISFTSTYNQTKLEDETVWNKHELYELKKAGISLKPTSLYPFFKDKIYNSQLPFNKKSQEKTNVILIFIEGLSARTTEIYSKKFPNLTPNLVDFAKESMIVHNYYNHTAATYRGLHGQLCSLYPKNGGKDGWNHNSKNLPKTQYSCITNVLSTNGYKSYFLNNHWKEASNTHKMMYRLGFDSVISAEYLFDHHLSKKEKLHNFALTDHQTFESLTSVLETDLTNSPFFLSMYTYETHAWHNVLKDGVTYLDGKYAPLNTIKSMDHAFGIFWKKFQKSPLYKNTMIVITTDHAHYYDNEYIKLLKDKEENDYLPIFIDKIPLLIYNPNLQLPKKYNANHQTSLSLTPSLIHLLNLPNEKNSFIGTSIFDKHKKIVEYGLSGIELDFFFTSEDGIFQLTKKNKYNTKNELFTKLMRYSFQLEDSNKIFPYKHPNLQ